MWDRGRRTKDLTAALKSRGNKCAMNKKNGFKHENSQAVALYKT